MFGRILSHISRRTLQAILAVVFALILLFFALTRTQVGRDELGRQLEARFARSFEGQLEIGRLTGNLVSTLYATDVKVLSAEGDTVLQVDSVIVWPRWTSLVKRSFSVDRITLVRPRLHIEFSDSGRTSLSSAISTRGGEQLGNVGWDFLGARIEVQDGLVTTHSSTYRPLSVRNGHLFDFTNTLVHDINAEVSIDWSKGAHQVDLLALQATLPDPNLELETGASQFMFREDRFVVNRLVLGLGATNVTMSGHLERSQDLYSAPFLIDIEQAEMDFDGLSRVFPSLPLDGPATLTTHVQGPLRDMTLSWLRITAGQSTAQIGGTFLGLPTLLDFEFSVDESDLYLGDVRRLLPELDLLQRQPDHLSVGAYAAGTITRGPQGWPGVATLDVAGNTTLFDDEAGSLSWTFQVSGAPSDSLRHDVQIRTDKLNLAAWTGRPAWTSSLTSTIGMAGTGMDLSGITTSITTQVERSVVRGVHVDQLNAAILLSDRVADMDFRLSSGGTASLVGQLDLHGDWPVVTGNIRMEDLDVGPIWGREDVSTRLSGSADLRSDLTWSPNLKVDLSLDLDSSIVEVADSIGRIQPMNGRMIIGPPKGEEPVLSLSSDLFDLTIHSDTDVLTLVALSRGWSTGFRSALAQERSKTREGGFVRTQEIALAIGRDEERLSELMELFEERGDLYQVRMEALVDAKHPERLSDLWPTWSPVSGTGQVELNLDWGPGAMRGSLEAHLDSLSRNDMSADSTVIELTAEAIRSDHLLRTTQINFSTVTDSLTWKGTSLSGLTTRLATGRGSGSWQLQVPRTAGIDSIRVGGEVHISDLTNSLTMDRFLLHAGPNRWHLGRPATISMYSDAVVLDSLVLLHDDVLGRSGQSIRAWGAMSELSSDSLHLDVDDLLLVHLSDYLSRKRAFGGRLNSRFVLTGGRTTPRVSGSLLVERASLDRRILGDLSLTSNFIAGSPEVAIEVNLDPVSEDVPAMIIGTTLAADPVRNELSIGGTILLPGKSNNNEGALNLDVDIERLDLFFFYYIFGNALTDIGGYITGDGPVTGTFAFPEPDLSLAVLEGRFEIPRIGVTYNLTAEASLDAQAIHIDSASLTDTAGGGAQIDGRLNLNEYRFFTLDLQGRIDELQIMDVGASSTLPFYGFIYVSASFDLTGPLFDATLRSDNLILRNDSELFIPITEYAEETDESFIVFEDSVGVIPDFRQLSARRSILAGRSTTERQFLEALNLNLNITATPGSTIHLVIDPLLGDVISAISYGSVQFQRQDGEYSTFGQLQVTGGSYMFTAGEVFVRRFRIEEGGTITWDGDPVNAVLDIPASYRTRASRAGLQGSEGQQTGLIPVIVLLQISGTVASPQVDLSLAIDQTNQNILGDYQALETRLNHPDRAVEYATSVLLTNSFQLTTENISSDSGSQLAFNSVSQLVSSQLNRFLNEALPNVDFSFGLLGETAQDLDVTYGVALRLLDERLIIRGEGVYEGRTTDDVRTTEGLQGEFVVEIRLSPQVSVEVFFRREGDILGATELTNTTGVGVYYQTEFITWSRLIRRVLGTDQG